MRKEIKAILQNEDPNPVEIITLIATVVSATTGLASLIINVSKNKREKEEFEKLLKQIKKQNKILSKLQNDLHFFKNICKPNILIIEGKKFFSWNLNTLEYKSLKKFLKRLIKSYSEVLDLRNKLGKNYGDILGATWHLYDIEDFSETLVKLSEISDLEMLKKMIEAQSHIINKLHDRISKLTEFDSLTKD